MLILIDDWGDTIWYKSLLKIAREHVKGIISLIVLWEAHS